MLLKELTSMPTSAAAPARSVTAPDSDSGLMDLLLVLSAYKRFLISFTLAGGLLAALIAFLLPDTYTAAAILMPPQQSQASVSAMLGQLGPLAAVAGSNLGLKSPAELYIGLAGSRTIADHIIERFDLRGLYRAKTMVDARNKLRGRSRFSAGKDSLIHIEVDDYVPQHAADLANAYVSELNVQNTSFGTTEAAQRKAFLEKQVVEERIALAAAEDAMKQIQLRTGIVHVEAQTTVAIASAAQLKAQITAGEVALKRLEMGATSQNPEVLKTQAELDTMRTQLRELEIAPHAGGDPLVATSSIPGSGLEYMRGLRELKYHEFLFEMLSKQYEAARIDESRMAPALQIVDAAVPPDKKSGPHRGLIILFGLIAAGALASVWAYHKHSHDKSSSHPIPQSPTRNLPTHGADNAIPGVSA